MITLQWCACKLMSKPASQSVVMIIANWLSYNYYFSSYASTFIPLKSDNLTKHYSYQRLDVTWFLSSSGVLAVNWSLGLANILLHRQKRLSTFNDSSQVQTVLALLRTLVLMTLRIWQQSTDFFDLYVGRGLQKLPEAFGESTENSACFYSSSGYGVSFLATLVRCISP